MIGRCLIGTALASAVALSASAQVATDSLTPVEVWVTQLALPSANLVLVASESISVPTCVPNLSSTLISNPAPSCTGSETRTVRS